MPTILITGANRGIGLELTRQYADDGWTVLACCRSPANAHELHRLVAEFNHPGHEAGDGPVVVHPLDVTDDAQRADLVARLAGRPIDILLNNAGISGNREIQGFGQCRAREWLEVLHVNVIAPMLMIQALVDNVAASERRIVANISSMVGSIAHTSPVDFHLYFYGSSKAALNKVSATCARELAGRGITVVVLRPGWVRTRLGGPDATLSVEESATALRRNLAGVTPSDAGRFIDIDGATIPW